jgi:hypothetical protein
MAVFDLEAIIRLNDQGFKRGLSAAGKAIGTFAKVAGGAVAAGAAGVAALATSSVKAYADYEQLAGGVEKLFGNGGRSVREYASDMHSTINGVKDEWRQLELAQNTVLQNAENAYATAGMSANEYLDNVTGISAALINSYSGDTVKAAEQADKAMVAISDNVNTFGSDVSSVRAAYQGFAKQNYTMLDNLKLGYGGTRSEMERLIKDANEYREVLGLTGDLSIQNYGDVVEAIDLIQQKQGIAGTTAKEAATTISGSLNMTKAAWKNLVRAFSDKNADLSVYFDNLVTSAETAFNNILPVAEQALTGIGQIISDLAPVIGEKLPELISTGLPKLVSAGTGIVTAIISGIAQALPALVEALPDIWNAIKDGFVDAWPALKEAGGKLMDMLGEGMAAADAKIAEVCANFEEGMREWASRTWQGVKDKASEAWEGIKSGVSEAWDGIKGAVVTAWENVKNGPVWTSIKSRATGAWNAIKGGVSTAWEGIKGAVVTALTIFHLKNGKDKEFVREQILDRYYPDWSDLKYADFHDSYTFNSTCPGTVGPAIICFLESKDYVDCIKLAISLGGDADTLAAIAGPMAYAYFRKMPDALVYQAMKKLPEWMVQVNERFDEFCGI